MTQPGDDAPSVDAPRAGRNGGSIEEIVRRLDGLLRTVNAAPGHADGVVGAHILNGARRAYRARRTRERMFGTGLLVDLGWDILLDLFIAADEGRKVSLAGICAASRMPEATARCIGHLIEAKLVTRQPDPGHPEQVYLALTAEAEAKMCDYFRQAAED